MTPEAELRQVNKRIAVLRQRQRELVTQLGLSASYEKVILAGLKVADDVARLLEAPGTPDRRKVILMLGRVHRAGQQLERLLKGVDGDHPAYQAADAALTDAGERLLSAMWPDTSVHRQVALPAATERAAVRWLAPRP